MNECREALLAAAQAEADEAWSNETYHEYKVRMDHELRRAGIICSVKDKELVKAIKKLNPLIIAVAIKNIASSVLDYKDAVDGEREKNARADALMAESDD